MRLIGLTQSQAAGAVGRSARTLRVWESEPSWADAKEEARQRWLVHLEDAARAALLKAVKAGNAELAFRVLERTVPELRPPAHRHRHTGGMALTALLEALPEEELDRLAALSDEEMVAELKRLASGQGPAGEAAAGMPARIW